MENQLATWPQVIPWLLAGLGPAAGVFFAYLRDRDKSRLEREKLLHDAEVIELRLKLAHSEAQRTEMAKRFDAIETRTFAAEKENARLLGRVEAAERLLAERSKS